ncbi:MAG: isoprenylcysteine carboxylmethyltransferase family protein [Sulfurovum sp.]|nr:MAG: isoprenylcysteine carboxylmethyltransferase family protein [Sulfurovum sp.]
MTQHPHYPKILVFLQFGLIGLMLLFSTEIFSSLLGLGIFFVGLAVGIFALLRNRLGNFNIQPKMKENAELITTGIYAYVRHPMYLSLILMMLGVWVGSPTFLETLFMLLLILTLLLKAKKEESIWLQESEAYVAYKKRSKLLLPFIL